MEKWKADSPRLPRGAEDVEPKAAKLAAIRATESHLRRIETQCIKVQESSTWKEVEEHDLLLHTAIIDAAGNPILSMINSALTRFLHRSREITGARAPDCKEMLNAHSKIVDAILKGDVEEAEQAMLGHLHRVGLDLISDRKRRTVLAGVRVRKRQESEEQWPRCLGCPDRLEKRCSVVDAHSPYQFS